MDKVASSNLVMSSRDVLKEKALAAWRFQPSGSAKDKETEDFKASAPNAAWIVQASQRDMEFVVSALQKELNSQPLKPSNCSNSQNIFPSNEHSDCSSRNPGDVASSSDRGSPQVARSFPGLADSQAVQLNRQKPPPIPGDKKNGAKKRSRGGGRCPVTFVAADPVNFRDMVQQVTGAHINTRGGGSTLLKPQAKRACASTNVRSLPTLDSSSSLPHGNLSASPSFLDFPALFGNNVLHNLPFYGADLPQNSLAVTSPSPSLVFRDGPSGLGNYYGNHFQNAFLQKSENRDGSLAGAETFLDFSNNSVASRWVYGSKLE